MTEYRGQWFVPSAEGEWFEVLRGDDYVTSEETLEEMITKALEQNKEPPDWGTLGWVER